MLLSIGMIVKNEEKYLERCLTALKPLLDSVDSELIIADTGSTDRTVEIAEKFTDNVKHFDWIKDFAAARNATLSAAQGEWYMFLDADEIFQSCDEIISFFNSGEYKKYLCATVVIRNYVHEGDFDVYKDFNAPRLTKVFPETKFVGAVHEILTPLNSPMKNIAAIADHFGYIVGEEYEKKLDRNIELLLKKMDAGDISSLLYMQLFECYVNRNTRMAKKYLDEGIKYGVSHNELETVALLSTKAEYYFTEDEYSIVLDTCERYFKLNKVIRPEPMMSDIDILGYKASSLCAISRYAEAVNTYKAFFDVFKKIKTGKINNRDSALRPMIFTSDKMVCTAVHDMINASLETGDYSAVTDLLRTLPIATFTDCGNELKDLVDAQIELLDKTDFADADNFYKQHSEYGKKLFADVLLKKLYLANDKRHVLKALLSLEGKDSALYVLTAMLSDHFEGKGVTADRVYDFVEKHGASDYADVFYIAMAEKTDISPLLKSAEEHLDQCVYDCYFKKYGFPKISESYTADLIKDDSCLKLAAKFTELSMKAVITYKSPKPGVFVRYDISALFDRYGKFGVRAHEAGLGDTPDMQAAYSASKIAEYRNEKKYKECYAEMKNVLETYPNVSSIIRAYSALVSAQYEREKQDSAGAEMARLAQMLKKNIRACISAGRIDDAQKIISEYEQINPKDPDIPILKAELAQ